MLGREPGNLQESSISVCNVKEVRIGYASESIREGCGGGLNFGTQMGTLTEKASTGFSDKGKADETWIVPEGYRFLPEEFFRILGIPPPLVSLCWFKIVNSDEESSEDSIPLARLKKVIEKNRKVERSSCLKSISAEENSNKIKEKVKKERNEEEVKNVVNRRRGRPKKESTEVISSENEFQERAEDFFWNSEGDSVCQDSQFPVQCETVIKVENENLYSTNQSDHDYFKSIENGGKKPETTLKKGKRKKTKITIKGVKGEDCKIIYPCSECGKCFSAASTLKSHQRIHNGTLLICTECQKGFVNKYLLKCHMRIHNGDLFMCHKCGRGFTTAELLKVHGRAHTGDRPFICNVCGKSFPTSSNMLQHKQSHNSEKKFLCSHCGSSFVQKRCLEYHMLAHSEKKNICNVCGKLWARKSDLIEHMRVHTGVKPYCCSICPQKFSQASSLKRHQLVHLDEKPFSCDMCNKKFKCQDYFKRHLRKHKNEE